MTAGLSVSIVSVCKAALLVKSKMQFSLRFLRVVGI